jgi:leucyl aminopeptidase
MTRRAAWYAVLLCWLLPAVAAAQYLNTSHTFTTAAAAGADTLVLLLPKAAAPARLAGWSEATAAQLQRALTAQGFDAAAGARVEWLAPQELPYLRLIALGIDDPAALTRAKAEQIGADLAHHLNGTEAAAVAVDTTLIGDTATGTAIAAAMAHGTDLANYRFDRYKSKPEPRPAQRFEWVVAAPASTQSAYAELGALAEGVFLARDLTNLSGTDGHPAAFAEYARQQLEPLGVVVTILDAEQVKALGMGSLYGAGKGHQHKSHLLAVQWRGSDEAPIALVGKGISFDSGGYNLKVDAASILAMTGDMAGGAAVVGAVKALAGQKAPIHVVGVVPLALNAVSGEAQLPGDVVTAGNGMTIEVANTDAEGRLVLADGIWYAREQFKPRVVADIATLTGSKVMALGTDYAAMFSAHEDLIATMSAAGELTAERVWRLPLGPYEGIIDSKVADVRNIGAPGMPGAQAGAVFLQRFAADTPWVHIDMAGNESTDGPKGIYPGRATGYGVRLLAEWVKLYARQD